MLPCTTNTPNNEGAETYNPVKLTTIAMPPRSMSVVGWESGQCEIIEIPKGQKTPLLPLANDVKYVSCSIPCFDVTQLLSMRCAAKNDFMTMFL